MAGYIGTVPSPQGTMRFQTFEASSGQTSFGTAGYTPGFIFVTLNGVKLIEGASATNADYVATNGSDVVLHTGAASGDILEVVAFTATDTFNTMGGGLYRGNRSQFGSAAASQDIFRVHDQTLSKDVTIGASENAIACGAITISSGVVLTVATGGHLSIV